MALNSVRAQVPTWSAEDLRFFLHGSMGTEIFPEPVLRTFIKVYPDLFPTSDLTHLGLIPDQEFGWPIGLSRKTAVKHLGNLPAVGINCASCHVSQITSTEGSEPIRILGTTSDFNVEAFFGSVLGATFKTTDLVCHRPERLDCLIRGLALKPIAVTRLFAFPRSLHIAHRRGRNAFATHTPTKEIFEVGKNPISQIWTRLQIFICITIADRLKQ